VIFSGYFARLHRYLPAGQSSMCNSTPPVDRRAKPCTHAKFRAKREKIKFRVKNDNFLDLRNQIDSTLSVIADYISNAQVLGLAHVLLI
jgi:hypothetical protein